MEVGKLTVQRRSKTGKSIARKLRAAGRIPGVCYGVGMDEPLSLSVDTRELKESLDPLKRQNTVIDMFVEGEDGSIVVMVKDYQVHPIRRSLVHVDLIAIDTEKPVDAEVPVELTGKPKGLVTGGKIHVERRDVEVRCRPADIPAKIVLDITELDVGDVLHVSDITLPEGVEPLTPEHLALVTCVAAEIEAVAEEEAEGEAAAADDAAPAAAPEGDKK